MIRGIDVSAANGYINWTAMKNNIDFAMIQVGYGTDMTSQDDKCAITNMQACDLLNIPYGVYLYSYAMNTSSAQSEATHAVRMIRGHRPKLGVYFDMEDADYYKRKHNFDPLTHKSEIVNICNTFLTTVKNYGYTNVGIYASLDYFNNIIGVNTFNCRKWLANWFNNNGPQDCQQKWATIWQYSEKGKFSCSNSTFDLNYYLNEQDFNALVGVRKTDNQLAIEVLCNKWGVGDERRVRLTAAGYNYLSIQNIINQKLTIRKSNEEIADEVLKNLWGTGEDRQNSLTAAGYNYIEIQNIVNNKFKI